jgi:MscS family membrane protein
VRYASLTATLLQAADPQSLLEYVTIGRVAFVVVTLVLAFVAIRAAVLGINFMARRVPRARFFFKRLDPFVRIIVWFAAAFTILSALSPSRDTFLAGIGSIAIALGLGAQDLIKNVIGGIVVLTDRPYQLGDRVQIGEAYGEIDHIGLRSTKLTTPDDTRVTLPNSEILTHQIFNSNSGVPDCQVVTDVILPFDVDSDEALRIGREAAYASPYLLVHKPVTVLIADQFQDNPYVRLRIKAYVHDHRFEPRMQSDITARAKAEFRRRGMLRTPNVRGSGNGIERTGA